MSHVQSEPTLATEVAFSGRLVDVRKVTVRLPSGDTTIREIVTHPECVAILAVKDTGELILVRQFRKAAERVLLEVPAGGVDPGEAPEQAARREMVEETGYRAGRTELLTGFFTSPGFTTEFMHLFLATGLEAGEPTEQTDQIEVVEMHLADALEQIGTGGIIDAKSILSLLLYARNVVPD